MLAGCLTLLAGAVVTLAAIQTTSAAAFLTGTAVAGAGLGTAMLGAFRTVSALAAPGQRASLVAAYFIASYAAFSIPVVIAGMAITLFGLHRTALVYCAVIAVLAAVAAGSLIFRRHSAPAPMPPAAQAGPPAQASDTQGRCQTPGVTPSPQPAGRQAATP
jgi:MFS family permease